MKKSLIAAIAVVAVGIVITFVVMRAPAEKVIEPVVTPTGPPFAPPTSSAISQSRIPAAEIIMRDNGFEPASLTVAAGTTVVFRNTGDNDHWPASDVHPTHERYSEFDPRKPIPPGGTWNFTFEKEGAWRFHDHLQQRFPGLITVTP